MSSSLIWGKYVVSRVLNRNEAVLIADGAIFQRDGKIVEIGTKADLLARHQPDEIIGSDRHVILPGFVNGHHHMGVTPTQHGAPDLALELWIARLMAKRNIDPYLDTLYSAFEMIGSGVTTVQHIQYGVPGPVENIYEVANEVLRAYRDIGMRASYSYVIMDQNRLLHQDDALFAASLPKPLGDKLVQFTAGNAIPLDDNFKLFKALHEKYATDDRLKIQLAPANLHWLSDEALLRTREYSDAYDVPMHLHLLETKYQREYAFRRTGRTAVEHIEALGLLGPRLTLGHAVWLSEPDIERVAASGCHICNNASSNLRIRSGIAPVNHFARHGIPVCVGIDEAGINDDRDMLQEMRVVLNIHRTPGMDDDPPTCAQVLLMATEYGARTTPFGGSIGTLEPGRAADCVLLDWQSIAHPYLDADLPIVDAIVKRATARSVDTVIVAGEPILRDGRSTRLDRTEILAALADDARRPLTLDEIEFRGVARQVFDHVKQFYAGYQCNASDEPYRYNDLLAGLSNPHAARTERRPS
ncbi:amidohydrolase family protein [Pseudaminobacter sp. NGMCC 1.201702]|uniref:amidohydrolase family protein n=1 Tax=Pseudaminobacter sp. NGMCC 1.201702 TaxID=3391825 RepID=UPI0039F12B8A